MSAVASAVPSTAAKATPGIALATQVAGQATVLPAPLLALLVSLHRAVEPGRQARLQARRERQAFFDQGGLPDFRQDTTAIRSGDWTVAPLPAALTPVYPSSAQLPQVYLRKAIGSALSRAPAENPDSVDRLDRIRHAVSTMTMLIDRTVSSARLEAGTIAVETQTLDLGGLVREICERLFLQTARIWLKSMAAARIDVAAEVRIFADEIDEVLRALAIGDVRSAALIHRTHISMSYTRMRIASRIL